MQIEKKLIKTSFSLVIGISLFMATYAEVFAKNNCESLREAAKQLQVRYRNDKDYLNGEGDSLWGHYLVNVIKANLLKIEAQFNKIAAEYRQSNCHPSLGSISSPNS
ncbi:MAG: hypothetical protein JSS34_08085 [Proteobacteria bacterium]|nr:hypothetical protein [Pseudomonadota bacterium]